MDEADWSEVAVEEGIVAFDYLERLVHLLMMVLRLIEVVSLVHESSTVVDRHLVGSEAIYSDKSSGR